MKNNKNSKRIQNIYESYYLGRAQEKFANMIRHIDEFLDVYASNLDDSYTGNFLDISIKALVESYYIDVIYYKEQHFNPDGSSTYPIYSDDWCRLVHNQKLPNLMVAAYTAKWILKYSPIFVSPESQLKEQYTYHIQRQLLSVNSMFCLAHIRGLLGRKSPYIHLLDDENIIRELMQMFLYGTFDERHFLMIFNSQTTFPSTRIFLASPSDVKPYREATVEIVDSLNKPIQKSGGNETLFLYWWEGCKSPGYTENYQKDMLREFGSWCDIFILLLWHRIGDGGTEEEYDTFVNIFRKNNPDALLLVALVREPVDPYEIDPENLIRLKQFIDEHKNSWSLLGQTWDAISCVDDYRRLLRSELSDFMNRRLGVN